MKSRGPGWDPTHMGGGQRAPSPGSYIYTLRELNELIYIYIYRDTIGAKVYSSSPVRLHIIKRDRTGKDALPLPLGPFPRLDQPILARHFVCRKFDKLGPLL